MILPQFLLSYQIVCPLYLSNDNQQFTYLQKTWAPSQQGHLDFGRSASWADCFNGPPATTPSPICWWGILKLNPGHLRSEGRSVSLASHGWFVKKGHLPQYQRRSPTADAPPVLTICLKFSLEFLPLDGRNIYSKILLSWHLNLIPVWYIIRKHIRLILAKFNFRNIWCTISAMLWRQANVKS